MRETLRLGEDLMNSMIQETEVMLAERQYQVDLAESRVSELEARLQDEIHRIDNWAEKQKAVAVDVFTAMINEARIDRQNHETAIKRLTGDAASLPKTRPAKPMTPADRFSSRNVHRFAAE